MKSLYINVLKRKRGAAHRSMWKSWHRFLFQPLPWRAKGSLAAKAAWFSPWLGCTQGSWPCSCPREPHDQGGAVPAIPAVGCPRGAGGPAGSAGSGPVPAAGRGGTATSWLHPTHALPTSGYTELRAPHASFSKTQRRKLHSMLTLA